MLRIATIEILALKALLKKRKLRTSELAFKIGIAPKTLWNHTCIWMPDRAFRLGVESALQVSLWSSSQEFRQRRVLRAVLDVDVYTLGELELNSLLKREDVRCPEGVHSAPKYIALLWKKRGDPAFPRGKSKSRAGKPQRTHQPKTVPSPTPNR